MKLPSGWIFILKMKNMITIEVEQKELITCKDCKHWNNAPTSDGYNSCEKDALIRHESFFCASGKLRGDSDEVN